MQATREQPLRVAWIERGNPIPSNPETKVVLEAFRTPKFRVVVKGFLMDTALEVDIVRPARNCFEQSGMICMYWHRHLPLWREALDPSAGGDAGDGDPPRCRARNVTVCEAHRLPHDAGAARRVVLDRPWARKIRPRGPECRGRGRAVYWRR